MGRLLVALGIWLADMVSVLVEGSSYGWNRVPSAVVWVPQAVGFGVVIALLIWIVVEALGDF